MPVPASVRHIAWVAWGVTLALSWSVAAVAAWWVRRQSRKVEEACRVPVWPLADAELDAELRALLRDAGEAR